MATGHAGPRDEAVRQQWRSARRAVLRAHHPDRGGDPDRMRSELDLVDRRFGVRPGATTWDDVSSGASSVDLRPPVGGSPWHGACDAPASPCAAAPARPAPDSRPAGPGTAATSTSDHPPTRTDPTRSTP